MCPFLFSFCHPFSLFMLSYKDLTPLEAPPEPLPIPGEISKSVSETPSSSQDPGQNFQMSTGHSHLKFSKPNTGSFMACRPAFCPLFWIMVNGISNLLNQINVFNLICPFILEAFSDHLSPRE